MIKDTGYFCVDDEELKNVCNDLEEKGIPYKIHRNKEPMMFIRGKHIKYMVNTEIYKQEEPKKLSEKLTTDLCARISKELNLLDRDDILSIYRMLLDERKADFEYCYLYDYVDMNLENASSKYKMHFLNKAISDYYEKNDCKITLLEFLKERINEKVI